MAIALTHEAGAAGTLIGSKESTEREVYFTGTSTDSNSFPGACADWGHQETVGAHDVSLQTPPPEAPLNSFLCHLDANGWLVRAADFTSICLLTSSSGSRSSWLRNKSRTGPFLNGFGWRLVIKSVTTPRGDIGEEPSWVCKELHTGWLTYLCCVRTALHLTVFLRSLLSGQLSAFYWEIAGRMRLFSLLIFFCTRKLV